MRTTSLLAILFCAPLFAQGDRPPVKWAFWEPITDAERQLKAPTVDPNAGVEALFWKVWVVDEHITDDFQRVLYHYVRLKVFNEAGKQKIATIDIDSDRNTYITSVAARALKPDGTFVELGKDAIFERDVVRTGKLKVKTKSFALPGVEVGSIVEYRWREARDAQSLWYLRAQLQREHPVQRVTYYIKRLPSDYTSYSMKIRSFGCPTPPMKRENDGFESLTMQKLPPFEREPLMPSPDNVRCWALFYYTDEGDKSKPDVFWEKEGKKLYGSLKEAGRIGDEIKAAALAAVAGGSSNTDKAARLLRYVRSNVRYLFAPGVSSADRAKVLSQMPKTRMRTAGEIFKSGLGSTHELNRLFAALARGLGLDARPAYAGSRDDLLFDRRYTDTYFLSGLNLAVRDGANHWQLFDVSEPLLPAGRVPWQEEGMAALITDSKQPEFITVPITPAEDSLTSRSATLVLDADGALEGDMDVTWTGHSAYDRRDDFDEDSDGEQQERVKKEITGSYPQAEVTAIQLENARDPEKLLRLRYHVRIPNYAQRTGKRLLFQPFFFQRGVPPKFTATDRKYDVHFHYGWREEDKISVKLPAGFQLERAETPQGVDLGPLGSYKLALSTRANELTAQRELVFAREARLAFPVSAYPVMKELWETIQRRDNHVLSLRQTAAPGATGN